MSGRYEAWGVRPEGSYCVSCQDDVTVAFGDAASVGSGDVYDTVERRWVNPEDGVPDLARRLRHSLAHISTSTSGSDRTQPAAAGDGVRDRTSADAPRAPHARHIFDETNDRRPGRQGAP